MREVETKIWKKGSNFYLIRVYEQAPTDPNFDPDSDKDKLNGNELGTHGYDIYRLSFNGLAIDTPNQGVNRNCDHISATMEWVEGDYYTQWGVDTCLENAKQELRMWIFYQKMQKKL
tara:strand:- start:138 stop:488 length:351 start_codon:yes stop_codon:yes gene_type:complete